MLDLYGYVDKNGDGWREQPNGEPLLLEYSTSPTAIDRQLNELWKRSMDAIGAHSMHKGHAKPHTPASARSPSSRQGRRRSKINSY